MLNADDINRMIRCGSVTLFFRPEYLDEMVSALKTQGYAVDFFDCATWLTQERMHEDLARILNFPDYYGHNLDALDECLAEIDVPKGGRVLVFTNFDSFALKMENVAWHVLDIFASKSRRHLLSGHKLIALLQSNNPRLEIKPIGAEAVGWNEREWMNKNRGL